MRSTHSEFHRVSKGFSDILLFARGKRRVGFWSDKAKQLFCLVILDFFSPQEQERLVGNYSAS